MADAIRTPIALEAQDLMPETWKALSDARTFGPAALARRHDRVVGKIFGSVLDQDAQEALEEIDSRIVEYAGKMLAYELLDPGIEYWSRQIQSRTQGDTETVAYLNRAQDLRQLKQQWQADLQDLYVNVVDLLPYRPDSRVSAPQVIQAGDGFAHVTPNPMDIPPAWVPDTSTTTGTS